MQVLRKQTRMQNHRIMHSCRFVFHTRQKTDTLCIPAGSVRLDYKASLEVILSTSAKSRHCYQNHCPTEIRRTLSAMDCCDANPNGCTHHVTFSIVHCHFPLGHATVVHQQCVHMTERKVVITSPRTRAGQVL